MEKDDREWQAGGVLPQETNYQGTHNDKVDKC